jgi:undecaprenyl diphosphate synthase
MREQQYYKSMIYWLLTRLLRRKITVLPGQVCFMISGRDMMEAPDKLYSVTAWCKTISASVSARSSGEGSAITGLTFHIATRDPEEMARCLPAIRQIASIARLHLHMGVVEEVTGSGMDVVVAIGKSGREEITSCIRRLAERHVAPEQVDEAMLDSCLTFQYAPDVVIKSGGDHLTDFLIWQSVYSELFFSDVNWKYFREVDLLRILRDYQSRIRRYGK